jgi:predicted anti-sigma-YlaC factor YlaD
MNIRKVHKSGSRHDGEQASDLGVTADEVTCEQFVELVTDYFEGAMAPRTLGQVEEHLVMCDWCRAYAGQMRATVESLRGLNDQVSREPQGRLLATLRAKRATGQ